MHQRPQIPKTINPDTVSTVSLRGWRMQCSTSSDVLESCQRHNQHRALGETYHLSFEGALEFLSSILPSTMVIRPHNSKGSGATMISILHLEATRECHQLRDAGKGEQGPQVPPCPPKYDLSLQPSPCLPRPGQGVSLFPNCSLTHMRLWTPKS